MKKIVFFLSCLFVFNTFANCPQGLVTGSDYASDIRSMDTPAQVHRVMSGLAQVGKLFLYTQEFEYMSLYAFDKPEKRDDSDFIRIAFNRPAGFRYAVESDYIAIIRSTVYRRLDQVEYGGVEFSKGQLTKVTSVKRPRKMSLALLKKYGYEIPVGATDEAQAEVDNMNEGISELLLMNTASHATLNALVAPYDLEGGITVCIKK
jgi:hypothetical protein